MDELLKIVGAVAWVAGLVMLLVAPFVGVVVLLVAAFLSARSMRRTREKRHEELLSR